MKYTGRGFYGRHGQEDGEPLSHAVSLADAVWSQPTTPYDENRLANKRQFSPSRCPCGSRKFKRDEDRKLYRCVECERPWLGEQDGMRNGNIVHGHRRQP